MSQLKRRLKRLETRDGGQRVEVCPYPYWVGDPSPDRARWLEDAARRGVVVILQEAADF